MLKRNLSSLPFVLLLLASAASVAYAADADLQQYNRPAANAEAANGADALTQSLLLVRDGKGITADNNGAGKAPINRSIKQLADFAAGLRCSLYGNCMAINRRTLYSVQVDGTGGLSSIAAAGQVLASSSMRVLNASGDSILRHNRLLVSEVGGGSIELWDEGLYWGGTAASGANPTAGTAIKNQLRALNTPKAWFLVQADGAGTYTLVDGAGITSVAASGTAGDIDITMASAMDTTNYAVIVSGLRDSLPTAVAAIPASTTAFRLDFLSGSCATGQPCTAHGVVFGRQTTP